MCFRSQLEDVAESNVSTRSLKKEMKKTREREKDRSKMPLMAILYSKKF